MNRRERERVILDILAAQPIGTQAELVRALAARGFEVTQTTVSRDIHRLGLVKAPAAGGGYRYALPEALEELHAPAADEELARTFSEFVRDVDSVRDIIVIRTDIGAANAVAVAIEGADVVGVAATLAGDDTIFILTRSEPDRTRALAAFRALQED